jgi:putative ABC transport system substrate-binding protein
VRRVAVFEGANPGDLPIGQAKTFELVVNLKIAAAMGLTIPSSPLLRADEVVG